MPLFAFAGVVVLWLQPADPGWPPLPDFTTRIDYFGWVEKATRGSDPPDRDAIALYDALFKSLDVERGYPAEQLGFRGFRSTPDSTAKPVPWKPADHSDWEKAFEATRELRKQFAEAASRPYVGAKIVGPDGSSAPDVLMNFRIPYVSGVRGCVVGCSECAWQHTEGHVDAAQFNAMCRTSLTAARQVERSSNLVSFLVGLACRKIVYEDLQYALKMEIFTARERSDVLSMLEARDPPVVAFVHRLHSEAAMVYDLLQAAADASRPLPKLAEPELENAIKKIRDRTINPTATCAALREYYETMAKLAAGPFTSKTKGEMEAAGDLARPLDAVTAVLVPALDRAYLIRQRAEASRRATHLLYAIFVFKDKNGKWPESLDALPKAVTKACGEDPFSNKPFVYKVNGDTFMLYSVGLDAVDNEGKRREIQGDETPGSDDIYWPIP